MYNIPGRCRRKDHKVKNHFSKNIRYAPISQKNKLSPQLPLNQSSDLKCGLHRLISYCLKSMPSITHGTWNFLTWITSWRLQNTQNLWMSLYELSFLSILYIYIYDILLHNNICVHVVYITIYMHLVYYMHIWSNLYALLCIHM